NVTYTTIHFSDNKQSADYQNVFGKSDYVNIEPANDMHYNRKKALLKMGGSVEYSDVSCTGPISNKCKSPQNITPEI
ncbi:Hypothetical predicted protein, partial [Pelobates cultripes]